MSPAHSGATALVPPMTCVAPPTSLTLYPVFGSASPATSGTPRPAVPFGDLGTLAFDWYAGRANALLTPPPVPLVLSFQTTSLLMVVPDPSSFVPPHPRANGL